MGATKIVTKRLQPNDNSKQQIYLGNGFGALRVIPADPPIASNPGVKPHFKAAVRHFWLDPKGNKHRARHAQLILYPQYSNGKGEVRFSGFMRGCEAAPRSLKGGNRVKGRWLLLGFNSDREVLGYVADRTTLMARELDLTTTAPTTGVLVTLRDLATDRRTDPAVGVPSTPAEDRAALLQGLHRVHHLGWIQGKALTKKGVVPCNNQNCGGYTLEAELGIERNAKTAPDFRGWELKATSVKNFRTIATSSPVTLFTPEPSGGLYGDQGVEAFVRKYGYKDKRGRPNRWNFGGIHYVGTRHATTGMVLQLVGVDPDSGKWTDANGGLAMSDTTGQVAALWPFTDLMKHWTTKHERTAYVPYQMKQNGGRSYWYGDRVRLGVGTEFDLFLRALNNGHVYLDPSPKVELIDGRTKVHARTQFRIKSRNLENMYSTMDTVSLA